MPFTIVLSVNVLTDDLIKIVIVIKNRSEEEIVLGYPSGNTLQVCHPVRIRDGAGDRVHSVLPFGIPLRNGIRPLCIRSGESFETNFHMFLTSNRLVFERGFYPVSDGTYTMEYWLEGRSSNAVVFVVSGPSIFVKNNGESEL